MDIKYKNSFVRSQATTTKRIKNVTTDEMFSQRTHGMLFVTPRGKCIVKTREAIGRNRKVSINGAPPVKFKHTPFARQPAPIQIES